MESTFEFGSRLLQDSSSSGSRRLSSSVPEYAAVVSVVGMGALFFFVLFVVTKVLSAAYTYFMKKRIMKALLARRDTGDQFRLQHGYSWDYVMAFHVYDEDEDITIAQRSYNLRRVLAQLSSGGLEFRLFYNRMHSTVYCKIRASPRRLMKEAARINMTLELDKDELRKICREGRKDHGWGSIETPDESPLTRLQPFDHIYCPYVMDTDGVGTRSDLAVLYKKWKSTQLVPLKDLAGSKITQEKKDQEQQVSNLAFVPGENDGEDAETIRLLSDQGGNHNEVSLDKDLEEGLAAGAVMEGEGAGGGVSEMHDITTSMKVMEADPSGYENTKLVEYESIFRGVDRLKLIDSIISNKSVGGCALNVGELLRDKCIEEYSPLHDDVNLRELEADWITLFQMPWNQATAKVKDYYGEKIGLYFAWLGHYTQWLMLASVLGIIAYGFVQANEANPNAVVMPYFAGLMALWASLYLESWKRKESWLQMEWGTFGVEDNAQDRPQFYGFESKHPITGKKTLYYPREKRKYKQLCSAVSMLFSVGIVFGCLAAFFIVRAILQYGTIFSDWAASISSVFIAIQIEVLNKSFSQVALRLNDVENYRTNSDYEDALISKSFVFQFLNSFSSLFYVAFMKPFYAADACVPAYCFVELQNTLAALFMSRLFLANFVKLGLPMWSTRAKLAEAKKVDAEETDARTAISEVERMFMMPAYDPLMSTFDDYAAIVSQFGYMTMFVSAFPLVTVLSFVNNYVQLRVDAWRLTQISRRPVPQSAHDIGMWKAVLEMTGFISVLTNSGLVSFTGTFAGSYSWVWRSWIFVIMSTGLFAVKWLYDYIIPDFPAEVDLQLKRSEYLVSKVKDNRVDQMEVINIVTLRVRPNFIIHTEDDDPM